MLSQFWGRLSSVCGSLFERGRLRSVVSDPFSNGRCFLIRFASDCSRFLWTLLLPQTGTGQGPTFSNWKITNQCKGVFWGKNKTKPNKIKVQAAAGILLHTLGPLYLDWSTVWNESETTVLLISSHTDPLILKSNYYRDEPLDKCWPTVWLFNPLPQIHCSSIASIQQMANEMDETWKQSCGILISLQSCLLGAGTRTGETVDIFRASQKQQEKCHVYLLRFLNEFILAGLSLLLHAMESHRFWLALQQVNLFGNCHLAIGTCKAKKLLCLQYIKRPRRCRVLK